MMLISLRRSIGWRAIGQSWAGRMAYAAAYCLSSTASRLAASSWSRLSCPCTTHQVHVGATQCLVHLLVG